MNTEDQLRELRGRVERLEKEVYKPPTGPSGQLGIPTEVAEQLRELRDELAKVAEWQENTDRDLDRIVRTIGKITNVLRRWVPEAKDAGLRVLHRWIGKIRGRARAE